MEDKRDNIKDKYKIDKDAVVEFYKLLIKKRKSLTSEKSQREVQRDIGCSNSTISRMEKIGRGIYPKDGISMLNINVFMALIKYYDLSDEEIIYFIRKATGRLTPEAIESINLREKLKEKELEIDTLKKEREFLIKTIRKQTLEEVDNYIKQNINLLTSECSMNSEETNSEIKKEHDQARKLTIN